MSYSDCGSEPFSYGVIVVNCTGSLVVEVFYCHDQVGIDVIQPHGSPQSLVPDPVKCLLEVYEYVVEVLLML